VMGNSDQPGALPAEALLSLRLRPSKSDLMITLGGGLPLSQGIGTPDLRGVAGVAWAPRAKQVRTWNLPSPSAPPPAAAPIPAGKGRIAVRAQQLRAGADEPEAVQAMVVVLGTIAELDRRHHEIEREALHRPCANDGSARIDLEPGEYRVRVVAEGFQPSTQQLTVRAGEQIPLVVDLQPADRATFTAGAQGQVKLLPSQGVVPVREGSRALSTKSKDELAAMSSWWAKHLEGTFVVITGYASREELADGEPLHEQRGVAVKEAVSLPSGFTHCVTVRQGTCGNPQDPSECHKVTIDVTDLACPDLRPPGAPPQP
jgi:hypothetical protein